MDLSKSNLDICRRLGADHFEDSNVSHVENDGLGWTARLLQAKAVHNSVIHPVKIIGGSGVGRFSTTFVCQQKIHQA